jgi:prepilin-type N-terminal cleavage/methylation domain-containing protein
MARRVGSKTRRGERPAARKSARARRRRGFTLLELIMVLGLVGVLLAMAAPSLRGFMASRKTADAAAQVLALTQLAGSRAVAQGSVYRLNIDAPTGTYWLSSQQGGAFVDLNCEFGRRFQLPEGTRVRVVSPWGDVPLSYIEFQPNGRTAEATIELTGRQGEFYQVTCDSATEEFRIISPLEAAKP